MVPKSSHSRIPLHYQILIGIVAGAGLGYVCGQVDGGAAFINSWVKPLGDIFIRLLKLIAVPLIFVSLTKGISDLKDLTSLSRMGLRTVGRIGGQHHRRCLCGRISKYETTRLPRIRGDGPSRFK